MAKKLNTYNRAAGYLNKLFDLLNAEFYEGVLPRPTLTIQSTPQAYGHFVLNPEAWVSSAGNSFEINLGAGTLARPIEETCATLLHEMAHLYCYINGIKDTSNRGVYHNKRFRDVAESHGLTVTHHEKYGWTITSPADALLDFVLLNDLSDILISRNEGYSYRPAGGNASADGSAPDTTPATPKKSSSRKLVCPRCGISVRATKAVRIACMDCDEPMIEI